MDIFEKIEKLSTQKNYNFEGFDGVDNLETFLEIVGNYNSIPEFLADNPGAIEALIEWIGDHITPEQEARIDKEIEADVYEYFINHDERGEFSADVRNSEGRTIFEFKSDEDGFVDMIEDGHMRHKNDLDGLREYLIQWYFITEDAQLIKGN